MSEYMDRIKRKVAEAARYHCLSIVKGVMHDEALNGGACIRLPPENAGGYRASRKIRELIRNLNLDETVVE